MLVDQMMYIQEMDSKVSFKFNKISKSRLENILPLAQVSCLVKPILLRHNPFLVRQVSITSNIYIRTHTLSDICVQSSRDLAE